MSKSEFSFLLEGQQPDIHPESPTFGTWKSKALVIVLVCATVLATLKNTGKSSDFVVASKDPSNFVAFDQVYHDWETSIYQQAQVLSTVGISEHSHRKEDVIASVDVDDLDGDGELIYLNHTEGFDMLKSTNPGLTNDFLYYQQGWDAQINQAYCGIASAMAVMNSLRGKISLPQDPIYAPFPWATQLDIVKNECVRANVYDIDKMKHIFWGVGLEMAASILNCNLNDQGYTAAAHHVDPKLVSTDEIRSIFIDALEDQDTRLLINYDRGGITQGPMGHGHFSPIGAYDYANDSFLVMDVAKYKYPPVWVPTKTLMGGIASVDQCAFFHYPNNLLKLAKLIDCVAQYRGYVVISKDVAD